MFGAKFGSYSETDIFHCLEKEDRAQKVFVDADTRFKRALYNSDPVYAGQGLSEMVEFITLIILENKGNENSVCPVLRDSKHTLDSE